MNGSLFFIFYNLRDHKKGFLQEKYNVGKSHIFVAFEYLQGKLISRCHPLGKAALVNVYASEFFSLKIVTFSNKIVTLQMHRFLLFITIIHCYYTLVIWVTVAIGFLPTKYFTFGANTNHCRKYTIPTNYMNCIYISNDFYLLPMYNCSNSISWTLNWKPNCIHCKSTLVMNRVNCKGTLTTYILN